LLAPKAPALESPAKIKGKKLADQIGPSRFNQTTSFDNVSSLAEYGQPIPIPFGKRGTGSDGALTGGLILAPALVWSRLFSYGNFQRFEGSTEGSDNKDARVKRPKRNAARLLARMLMCCINMKTSQVKMSARSASPAWGVLTPAGWGS
jgi:hypothetical protein